MFTAPGVGVDEATVVVWRGSPEPLGSRDSEWASWFPAAETNLVDALVYDTNDADDAGLLAVLTPGQPQRDENGDRRAVREVGGVADEERHRVRAVLDHEARYNLAAQYLDQKRLDDAIKLLEEAARLEPNHETLHTRLGRVYMEKGRGEDAYRALSLVRRLYPENWFAPLGLAVLLAGTDRPDQARPLLADALRLGGKVAREEAAGYPALAALLAESGKVDPK